VGLFIRKLAQLLKTDKFQKSFPKAVDYRIPIRYSNYIIRRLIGWPPRRFRALEIWKMQVKTLNTGIEKIVVETEAGTRLELAIVGADGSNYAVRWDAGDKWMCGEFVDGEDNGELYETSDEAHRRLCGLVRCHIGYIPVHMVRAGRDPAAVRPGMLLQNQGYHQLSWLAPLASIAFNSCRT
jgi:hypothetical protein